MENLCDNCPDNLRGKCCYFNVEIEGYNIILDNQPCKLLDTGTGYCKDYEHRIEKIPYCLHGKDMFNKGGLPKGCLYLEGHPEREEKPKRHIFDIIDKLTPHAIPILTHIISVYNYYNNLDNIERFAIKNGL